MKYCTVSGCEKQTNARGMCKNHYYAWRKTYTGELQKGNTRHGMRHTRVYDTWCKMKARCLNTNSPDYPDYGGRGITVCKEWIDSFEAFYAYMGDKPLKYMSIDRIDVNGNYEPGNVRWATPKEQVNNRRGLSTNSSGVEGVHWAKNIRKWTARVMKDGKRVSIGSFKDIDDAELAIKNYQAS